MKHTDFQIGDYVYHKGKTVRVDVLGSSDLGLYVADEDGANGALYKDIKPIPITPEILEKNNIIKSDNSSFYECENGKQRIKILIPKSQRPFLDVNNDCECNIMMNFEYVHELQHALKICKINKEIEL